MAGFSEFERNVVNKVIPAEAEGDPNFDAQTFYFVTRRPEKVEELRRLLGEEHTVVQKTLDVREVQSNDPLHVLDEKAIEAWKKNGGKPALVDEASLSVASLDQRPGPYADDFTSTYALREALCRSIPPGADRSAVFRVGYAIYDGREVQKHVREVTGTIALAPRGANGFGFDDIFEPNGQLTEPRRTNAEMSDQEKDIFSPRRLAVEAMLAEPFIVDDVIFELPPPYKFQMDAIRKDKLNNPQALKHAFNLEALGSQIPNPDLKVDNLPPYHELLYADGQIRRFVTNPDTPSLGLVVMPIDTSKTMQGEPTRLDRDAFEKLTFWQLGKEEIEKALAVRAYEFSLYHNEDMYTMLRKMMAGEIVTPPRSNRRSEVIENMIKMRAFDKLDQPESEEEWTAYAAIAVQELGYARESADDIMSRTTAAHTGLIINRNGIPSSVFSLGGMPPVTGWKDVLTTSALSFSRSWIPRNSMYAENPELQFRLFHAAEADIDALELPSDIRNLVMSQIGLAVGSEDYKGIGEFARRAYAEGIRALRIYTTNPDPRTVWSAEAIRQACPEMFICVGPVVDMKQARKLNHKNIKVNLDLLGHGLGENCTSLASGAAANAVEQAYLMSIDPRFNDTLIGFEGGTGNTIGAFLSFIDQISLNRRGVAGGIETGGLFVEHSDGTAVQPYHGTASSVTQWLEVLFNPDNQDLANKRLNDAGDLRNVEGVPNYMQKARSIQSIVQNMWIARMFGGRSLADQQSHSIAEFRENIGKRGYTNHRSVSAPAMEKAGHHRTKRKR